MTADVKAEPGDCAGHFDGYPAMPVAVLGASMSRLVSHTLEAYTGMQGARWLTRGVSFDAHRLVPAGETVRMRAKRIESSSAEYAFYVSANSASEKVAEMTIRIDLVAA
ncbi:hypothetical protein [Amycolatopsis sp. cmx-11-12]|uniref:hypothetical protein n=1 Tax=Amycolatopsis sp. cmx-11-12 TaxID=2785795 RepID=UPI0039185FB5